MAYLQLLLNLFRSSLYDLLPSKSYEFKQSKLSSDYSYQEVLEFKNLMNANKSSMMLSEASSNLISKYDTEESVDEFRE